MRTSTPTSFLDHLLANERVTKRDIVSLLLALSSNDECVFRISYTSIVANAGHPPRFNVNFLSFHPTVACLTTDQTVNDQLAAWLHVERGPLKKQLALFLDSRELFSYSSEQTIRMPVRVVCSFFCSSWFGCTMEDFDAQQTKNALQSSLALSLGSSLHPRRIAKQFSAL